MKNQPKMGLIIHIAKVSEADFKLVPSSELTQTTEQTLGTPELIGAGEAGVRVQRFVMFHFPRPSEKRTLNLSPAATSTG